MIVTLPTASKRLPENVGLRGKACFGERLPFALRCLCGNVHVALEQNEWFTSAFLVQVCKQRFFLSEPCFLQKKQQPNTHAFWFRPAFP